MVSWKILLIATLVAAAAVSVDSTHHRHHRKLRKGKHGGDLVLGVGNLFKGLGSVLKLKTDIIDSILNLKAPNSFDDTITVTIRLVYGIGEVLEKLVPGLGNLFIRIYIAISKITVCLLGPARGRVCQNDFFGVGRIDGWSIQKVIGGFGLKGCRQLALNILDKHSGGKGLKFYTGAKRSLIDITLNLAGIIDIDWRSNGDKNYLSNALVQVNLAIGIIGNNYNKDLGEDVAGSFFNTCSLYLEKNGYRSLSDAEGDIAVGIDLSGGKGLWSRDGGDDNDDIDDKERARRDRKQEKEDKRQAKKDRKEQKKNEREIRRALRKGLGAKRLIKSIRRLFRGCKKVTRARGQWINRLIKWKSVPQNFDDITDLGVQLSLGFGSLLEISFIPGLGDLLSKIFIAISKITICLLGSGNSRICRDSYYKLGAPTDISTVLRIYGLTGCRGRILALINKHNKNKGLEFYSGSRRTIVDSIYNLGALLEDIEQGKATKDYYTRSLVPLNIIFGAVGTTFNLDIGQDLVGAYTETVNKHLTERGRKIINEDQEQKISVTINVIINTDNRESDRQWLVPKGSETIADNANNDNDSSESEVTESDSDESNTSENTGKNSEVTDKKSEDKKTRDTDKKSEDTDKKTRDTDKKSEDTDKKTRDTDKKSEDTDKKTRDTDKKSEDTDKKTRDTDKKSEDTDKKTRDTDKKSEDTDKKARDTDKKSEDTDKKTRDTDKKSEDTDKKTRDTDKESEDTDKKTRDTDKKSEDTDKKTRDTDKESEDTDKKTRDTDKKTIDTDKKTGETDKKTRDTDKKSEDTDKKTRDTDKKSEDTDKNTRDTDKESEDTDKKTRDTDKKTRDNKDTDESEKTDKDKKEKRDREQEKSDKKQDKKDRKEQKDAERDQKKKDRETRRALRKGLGGSGLAKAIKRLFRGLRKVSRAKGKAIDRLINWKSAPRNFDDITDLGVQLSLGFGTVLEISFIPGLGDLLSKIFIAISKITICLLGSGNSRICKDSYYKLGAPTDINTVLRIYGLTGCRGKILALINKYNKNKGLEIYTGSKRTILDSIINLGSLLEDIEQGKATKDYYTRSLVPLNIIFGAVGTTFNLDIGQDLVGAYTETVNKYLTERGRKTINEEQEQNISVTINIIITTDNRKSDRQWLVPKGSETIADNSNNDNDSTETKDDSDNKKTDSEKSDKSGSDDKTTTVTQGSDKSGNDDKTTTVTQGSDDSGSDGKTTTVTQGSDDSGSDGKTTTVTQGSDDSGSDGKTTTVTQGSDKSGNDGKTTTVTQGSDDSGSDGKTTTVTQGSDKSGNDGKTTTVTQGSDDSGSDGKTTTVTQGSDNSGSDGKTTTVTQGSDDSGSDGKTTTVTQGSDNGNSEQSGNGGQVTIQIGSGVSALPSSVKKIFTQYQGGNKIDGKIVDILVNLKTPRSFDASVGAAVDITRGFGAILDVTFISGLGARLSKIFTLLSKISICLLGPGNCRICKDNIDGIGELTGDVASVLKQYDMENSYDQIQELIKGSGKDLDSYEGPQKVILQNCLNLASILNVRMTKNTYVSSLVFVTTIEGSMGNTLVEGEPKLGDNIAGGILASIVPHLQKLGFSSTYEVVEQQQQIEYIIEQPTVQYEIPWKIEVTQN